METILFYYLFGAGLMLAIGLAILSAYQFNGIRIYKKDFAALIVFTLCSWFGIATLVAIIFAFDKHK